MNWEKNYKDGLKVGLNVELNKAQGPRCSPSLALNLKPLFRLEQTRKFL